jgi:hypothetical protein
MQEPQLVALHTRHERNFLCALNHFWAAFLAHNSAVLEEALIPGKSMAVIAEGHQT